MRPRSNVKNTTIFRKYTINSIIYAVLWNHIPVFTPFLIRSSFSFEVIESIQLVSTLKMNTFFQKNLFFFKKKLFSIYKVNMLLLQHLALP
jgi:hypothetical protein